MLGTTQLMCEMKIRALPREPAARQLQLREEMIRCVRTRPATAWPCASAATPHRGGYLMRGFCRRVTIYLRAKLPHRMHDWQAVLEEEGVQGGQLAAMASLERRLGRLCGVGLSAELPAAEQQREQKAVQRHRAAAARAEAVAYPVVIGEAGEQASSELMELWGRE